MLQKQNIIAFLATSNAQSAREFFERKLGLKFCHEDDFAILYDLNGTDLRVQKVSLVEPQRQTVLGWSVVSIEETVRGLVKNGVDFIRYTGLTQDDLGIWNSPSGAKIAWFSDPDGNILSLTEHSKT